MTEELQQIAAHRKLRLVVDTNLFISSLLSPRGSERALIEACFAGKFELLYCEHLLQEIEDVISREKFRKRFTVEEGLSLIDAIALVGTEVPDRAEQKLPRICDDPDDNFLSLSTKTVTETSLLAVTKRSSKPQPAHFGLPAPMAKWQPLS